MSQSVERGMVGVFSALQELPTCPLVILLFVIWLCLLGAVFYVVLRVFEGIICVKVGEHPSKVWHSSYVQSSCCDRWVFCIRFLLSSPRWCSVAKRTNRFVSTVTMFCLNSFVFWPTNYISLIMWYINMGQWVQEFSNGEPKEREKAEPWARKGEGQRMIPARSRKSLSIISGM